MSDRTPTAPDPDEFTFREGLIVVASLLGVMIGVLALRYAFIGCIDVCILCQAPWFLSRRRRQTQAEAALGDQELPGAVSADLNNLLLGLTMEERHAAMESILSYKTVTSEDLVIWRGSHGAEEQADNRGEAHLTEHAENGASLGHPGDNVCSICLHEIEIGHVVGTPHSCKHVFHRKCILEWLERNTACPYCRSHIITEDAVKDALQSQP